MKLEKEFKEYWKIHGNDGSEFDAQCVFEDAYRLGLTRAAEICNNEKLADNTGHEADIAYDAAITDCWVAILTERDKD